MYIPRVSSISGDSPSDGIDKLNSALALENERIKQDAVEGMIEWFQWRSQLAVILAMREQWSDLRDKSPEVIQQAVAEQMRLSIEGLRVQCELALQKLKSMDGKIVDVEKIIKRQMPQDPELQNAPFDLPALRVTLSKESGEVAGSGVESRNSELGDYFEVVGEQVHIKPGAAFSMYNLASLLPLLAGAQHAKDPNDWFTKLRHVRSVDPSCGSKFEFEHLGPVTFMLNEVENVSIQNPDSEEKE